MAELESDGAGIFLIDLPRAKVACQLEPSPRGLTSYPQQKAKVRNHKRPFLVTHILRIGSACGPLVQSAIYQSLMSAHDKL